jgi:predicted PurR-regulated permease PerM
VVTDVSRAISGLLRAQLVLIVVTVIVGIVGLAIMRIGYSLILGTAIGLTGWVPIVGSGLITFPWAIGALVMGNYILAIKVLLLQGIATSIRHIIEPKLLASNMGLGTFPTLIGMYIGLTSMGVLGIVLGPIMIIALRSLIRADIFSDILPERSTLERKEDIGGKERNS